MTKAQIITDTQAANNAQSIMQKHGKTFALAAKLLTPSSRKDATTLYAFARTVDDWIDLTATNKEAQAKVAAIELYFSQQSDSHSIKHAINHSISQQIDQEIDTEINQKINHDYADIAAIITKYHVPKAVMHAFLQSQLHDEDCQQLASQQALIDYAYGVAGSIGRLMRPIIGASVASDNYAISLGIAMQLTNIARDVVEDAGRSRIYIPGNFFATAIKPQNIEQATEAEKAIIFDAITKLLQLADTYYAYAQLGYGLIPLRNRLSIAAAGAMYHAIGTTILARGQAKYWQGRVSLNLSTKCLIAISTVFKTLLTSVAFLKDSANQSANQIDEWHDSLLNNSLPNSLHKQIQQNSDLDMVNNITQSIQKAITRYELHSV